jgi:hypothetical protein
MTMAARTNMMLALVASLLLAAPEASAKVYVELRPRATLMAGYDDNVALDGNGADGFGQAIPGLKLDVFGEHQFHVNADCQAGIAHLVHPERFGIDQGAFASNESCLFGLKDHLDTRTTTRWVGRVTYAQDPFAIAGYGLLLRPGQTQVFIGKLYGEIAHALTATTSYEIGAAGEVLNFGSNDRGNGYVATPQMRYLVRTSNRTTWDVGVREQLFFAVGTHADAVTGTKDTPSGLINEGHAALAGVTYRLTEAANLIVRGGPLLVTGPHGQTVIPTGKVELEAVTPSNGVHLTVAHDLVIGASQAGPLVADIAELGLFQNLGRFEGELRSGIYRNGYVTDTIAAPSLIGYGGEASVSWKLSNEWKVGVAALRDAQLNDPYLAKVDRDVLQLRLTWERAKLGE